MVIITDSQGNPIEIAGSITLQGGSDSGGSGGGSTIDPTVLEGYLPLSAGSSKPLTGSLYANEGIYLGSDSSANNTKGIVFTNPDSQTTKLGFSNSGVFGIYASGYINISTPGILPVPTNTTSLGTSAYQYKNIYGTTIYQNGKQVANKEDVDTKSTIIWSTWS